MSEEINPKSQELPEGEAETAENDENQAPKVFTIEVLCMIKKSQQQHGLRHGDYQRYRGYCSRRVKRLRKTLHLPQGDRRHYKKKDVTVAHLEGKGADERFVHIPLILAERAWAYAMQLRQESNTEPRKKFHLVSKLKKAVVYAHQLQDLCNTDAFDARSKLECEAYVAWMEGSLKFELGAWREAAENLKKAQLVYQNLIQALPEEEQIIYKAKVDELAPSLRYCAYNIGGNASMDDLLEMRGQGVLNNLDALIAQTKTQSLETLQTTEWRGRKVTVRPEKVRLFLISIQDLAKTVDKAKDNQAKIEIIEDVLIDCKDAITAVRDEIKQDPKLRTASEDGALTGIQYLLSYLSHTRLMLTLERNLYMVAQAKQSFEESGAEARSQEGKRVRPQDISRLYEIILQNIVELQQLQGFENDAKYQAEINELALAFKAFRTYYIALTLINLKRWKEAVALYERSTKYAKEALQSNKMNQFNLRAELTDLVKAIEGSRFSAHAYSVLEDDSSDSSALYGKQSKTTKPLFERLSEYREDPSLLTKNPNVIKLVPEMEPIPCKPLFFDLALNFIEFPDLEDKIQDPKKGAGISGFVKGFLGWGGANK
ncbi:signal recognition particle subunit SRP68 [Culicoides brevitarsis]|uniref:signal recognition particle subunit SRP68 n=1 Tax=Culicoides brevitarsis TaxID=469753 RepID=UPI00307B626F